MSGIPPTPAKPTQVAGDGAQPPSDPPLVRFGLRQLLIVIAVLCVAFAVIAATPGMLRLVLVIAALAILAHVVSTFLGGRLRTNAERLRRWREDHGTIDPDQSASRSQPRSLRELGLPQISPLGNQTTRLPWMRFIVSAGAILGGIAGGITLAITIGHRITIPALFVGALSMAALGAWIAFLASGFVGISRHAWREAVTQQKEDRVERIERFGESK